jgi:hypothetical protein
VVVARNGVEALDYMFGTGKFQGRDPIDLPAVVLLDLETLDQLNFLRDCHCGIAQSYYLSRPMAAKHLPNWLAQRA